MSLFIFFDKFIVEFLKHQSPGWPGSSPLHDSQQSSTALFGSSFFWLPPGTLQIPASLNFRPRPPMPTTVTRRTHICLSLYSALHPMLGVWCVLTDFVLRPNNCLNQFCVFFFLFLQGTDSRISSVFRLSGFKIFSPLKIHFFNDIWEITFLI